MLHRAPLFLRVVVDHEWDALDQLEDTPKEGEILYAYKRKGEAVRAFIDFSGKSRKASGLYAVADYEFYQPQPSQAEMRLYETWAEWCGAQP